MKLALVCLGVASGDALKLSSPTTASGRGAAVHRRAFLGSAATAASLLVCPPAFAEGKGKKKEFMTLDDYQRAKAEEKKEEALYSKFESLRERAVQTKAFDDYAVKGEWDPISDLARAWDSTIRKDVLESAAKSLSGARCAAPYRCALPDLAFPDPSVSYAR